MWLEHVTEDTKKVIFIKATTVGLPARRGVGTYVPKRPYSHDPGDLGRGIYYSTNYQVATNYGKVEKTTIKFENPLVLTVDEAYQISDKFKTVRLSDARWKEIQDELKATGSKENIVDVVMKELVQNAENMTKFMLSQGHDGLIVIHKGHLELVDYRPYRTSSGRTPPLPPQS